MSIMDYMDNPYAPTTFGPSRRAGLSVPKDAPVAPTNPAPNPVPAGGGAATTPPPAATPAPTAQAPTTPGGVTAALPYSWYRDHFMQNQNLDDAGRSTQAISEEQWNAMSPQEQYNLFSQSSYGVDTNDPFYQQVNSRWNAAGNEGNGVVVNQFTDGAFKDPSKVWTDPTTGLRMTSRDNLTKEEFGLTPALGVGLVLGGGLAGNLLGLGAEGVSGAAATTAGATSAAPELLPSLTPSTAGAQGLLTAPELAGAVPAAEAGAGVAAPAAALGGAPEAAGAVLPGVTPASVPFEGTPFPLSDPGVTIPPTPTIPGSGSPSFTDRIINNITNNPLAAVGVGANLFAQSRANKNGSSAADQVRDAAKPISDQAKTLLEQYGKGELNPADEFNINRWEFEQIAKSKNYYASAGMGDSTAALAAEGRIREQAQGMRDTSLKGILQMGLQASGMALGPLIQAIQLQSKDDDQFGQAMSSALQSLFLLQAWQSKTPGVDT